MDKQEYIERFKYKLALIPVGAPTPEDFAVYMKEVAYLRSFSIHELRLLRMPGKIRARYNDAVNHLVPDYKRYLYRVSKNCQLCGFPIATIKEATTDHILARGYGGSKTIDNHQLAHPWCNVLKDADFNKVTGQHSRPRMTPKRRK